MRILVKYPKCPAHVESINNNLEGFQKLIGGYIEAVSFGNITVICDEEGRFKGRPFNTTINDVEFYGKIAFVGVDGDEFADLTPEAQAYLMTYYSYLFEEG